MIHLTPEQHVFVTERHLATLTTLRPDGTPHVVPVGFTWDDSAGVLRITTNVTSVKARNLAAGGPGGVPARAAVSSTAAAVEATCLRPAGHRGSVHRCILCYPGARWRATRTASVRAAFA